MTINTTAHVPRIPLPLEEGAGRGLLRALAVPVLLCASLLGAGTLRAARHVDTQPAPAETHLAPQPPRISLTTLDGRNFTGRLLALTPEIQIETADGPIGHALAEVLSFAPVDMPPSAPAATAPAAALRFHLADGSSFAAEIQAAAGSTLTLRLDGGIIGRVNVADLHSIRAAEQPTAKRKLAEVEREYLHGADTGAPTDDAAVVARGEDALVLRGRVLRLETERAVFSWSERELPLPWPRVAGLFFARLRPRSAPCTVQLRGGDCFAGRIAGGSAAGLRLTALLFEGEIELPWPRIERVDCRSERLMLLSDLRPARYEFEPFFDKRWPYAVDRTLTGRPIRLGGREYGRGVVLHSRAALTYSLAGRFVQFAAVAGVLDEMEGRGCVSLRVLGDGRTLWERDAVRGGQPPVEVTVDVAGVEELTLVVDYGDGLDLSDHAAWAFARLIR